MDDVPAGLEDKEGVEQLTDDRYLVTDGGWQYIATSDGEQVTNEYHSILNLPQEKYLVAYRGAIGTLLTPTGEAVTSGFHEIERFSDGLFRAEGGTLECLVEEKSGERISKFYRDIEQSSDGNYRGHLGAMTEELDMEPDTGPETYDEDPFDSLTPDQRLTRRIRAYTADRDRPAPGTVMEDLDTREMKD